MNLSVFNIQPCVAFDFYHHSHSLNAVKFSLHEFTINSPVYLTIKYKIHKNLTSQLIYFCPLNQKSLHFNFFGLKTVMYELPNYTWALRDNVVLHSNST